MQIPHVYPHWANWARNNKQRGACLGHVWGIAHHCSIVSGAKFPARSCFWLRDERRLPLGERRRQKRKDSRLPGKKHVC